MTFAIQKRWQTVLKQPLLNCSSVLVIDWLPQSTVEWLYQRKRTQFAFPTSGAFCRTAGKLPIGYFLQYIRWICISENYYSNGSICCLWHSRHDERNCLCKCSLFLCTKLKFRVDVLVAKWNAISTEYNNIDNARPELFPDVRQSSWWESIQQFSIWRIMQAKKTNRRAGSLCNISRLIKFDA